MPGIRLALSMLLSGALLLPLASHAASAKAAAIPDNGETGPRKRAVFALG